MTVAFDLPPLAVGLVIAALAAAIIVGGIERIAKFAQFVVPFMALVYMICALVILVQFSAHIVPVAHRIVVAAFSTGRRRVRPSAFRCAKPSASAARFFQ